MTAGWVESVPNVSEGRRPEVLRRLTATVRDTPAARLLDVHSDPDHNRSVFTVAGPAEAVADAAFGLARCAVELIDLRVHTGVHPRMGAIDVIPFVPLGEDDIDGCVALARETGRRIGDALEVPVYLYGAAAAEGRPRQLPEIRGRGFESLLELGDALPAPDFGPPRLHPTAGAVAVGARPVLVALNLLLEGGTLETARRIARRVRASAPGGLPGVRALGFWLEGRGRAQVSLNLVDLGATSMAEAVRRVTREAQDEGAEVVAAELVGLAPEAELVGLAPLAGLPGAEHSIEWRLREAAGAG